MRKILIAYILMILSVDIVGQNYTIQTNADDFVAAYAEELIAKNTANDSRQYSFTLTQDGDAFSVEYTVMPDNIRGRESTDNVWNDLEGTIKRVFVNIDEKMSLNKTLNKSTTLGAEQLGYDVDELQAMMNASEDRDVLLYKNKSYSAECRKAGRKVYYSEFEKVYTPTFKEAKADNLSQKDAMQKAADKAFLAAIKASNEAVRACNGEMYPSTNHKEEPIYEQPTYNEPVHKESAPMQQEPPESSSRYIEPAYEQPIKMAIEEKEETPIEQPQVVVEEQPKVVVEEPVIIFNADKKYLSFSEEGGSQQVHIEASSPWEIYSSPDWTDVRKSGSMLLVNCSANTQYSDKEEDLILRNRQGQKIIIVIAQDKVADFLTLSANVINENDGEGGRYIIHVHSNKPYKVTNTPQWCRPNSFSDSLVLSIEENKSGVERQCEVEVMVSERLKKTIFVKQSPLQHYVLVSPQVVTGSKRGGIITIHVESDDKWRVVNTPDWCQISEQKDDSFRLEITPNNTGAPRSAVFSVSAYGTRKNVTVKQE